MIYILSPHIDDAVFSFGGVLSGMKEQFTIIDIFSVSDYALNHGKDIEEVTIIRKQEERDVCNKLKCWCIFLDYLDRPLRKNDDGIEDHIYSNLVGLIEKGSTVYAPLCFSCDHIDHMIVKNISLKLKKYDIIKLVMYEDLPYVAYRGKAKESTEEASKTMRPEVIEIDITRKMALVNMYTSQIEKKVTRPIELYAYDKVNNRYTERMWYAD